MRENDGGWDFVKLGGIYQYKEEGVIYIVEIIEDKSTEKEYKFVLKPLACTLYSLKPFEISFVKNNTGYWNNMPQFYEEAEYVLLPIGTPWPYVIDNKYKYVGIHHSLEELTDENNKSI